MSLETKQKILDVADELFGEVGFDAATTREISERSGVNKALIHYHFESKEGLLDAVLDRYYEKLAVALAADALEGATGDRLFTLVDAYVDFLATHHRFARILQREIVSGRHVDRIVERTRPIFELGVRWLHESFPSTRGGALEASHLLVSFYGMVITWFSYQGAIGPIIDADPLSAEQLEQRKRHLHRMLAITAQALNEH